MLLLISFIIAYQTDPDSYCHWKFKKFVEKMGQPGKHLGFCWTMGDYSLHFYSLLKPQRIILVNFCVEYNEQRNGLEEKQKDKS